MKEKWIERKTLIIIKKLAETLLRKVLILYSFAFNENLDCRAFARRRSVFVKSIRLLFHPE